MQQRRLAGIIANLRDDKCKGVVLSLPGIMDSEEQAFSHAVRLKNRFEAENLEFLTCFWSANFAAELSALLRDIFERCRVRVGTSLETLDSLFEETARSAGRAFWRDIERHACCAALPCDDRPGLWEHNRDCDSNPRGKLGDVVEELADACAQSGKTLHILANGAGALVLDSLLHRAKKRAPQGADPLSWIPALGSLVLTFPAVPLDRANDRILPLAEAMAQRQPGSAHIFVPEPGLERRLSVHGYGHSILHLASRSFLDPAKKRYRPMLGSYRAAAPFAAGTDLEVAADSATPSEIPAHFHVFTSSRLFRLDQSELDSDPKLAREMLAPILAYTPPIPRILSSPSRNRPRHFRPVRSL